MTEREQRRELIIDTMASWALEGLSPSPAALERINSYVDGAATAQELIEQVKAEITGT